MTVPVLVAGHATLRRLAPSDAGAIVTHLNDHQVSQWLTMVPYPYGRADADWFLTDFLRRADTGPHWAIDAGYGLIGVISVKPDLGYWLGRAFHGRGIMSAAARAVVTWHFERSDDALVSGHHMGNRPSRSILVRLGFVDTHIDCNVPRLSGDPVDCQRMQLDRARWDSLQ